MKKFVPNFMGRSRTSRVHRCAHAPRCMRFHIPVGSGLNYDFSLLAVFGVKLFLQIFINIFK